MVIVKGVQQGEVAMQQRRSTRYFGVAESHKQLQVTNTAIFLMLMRLLTRTMKETDDDESDGNRNELMTAMISTKRMIRMMRTMKTMRMIKIMRMMRMIRMMRMMRMLRMRMRMKVRMMIMDEQGCCRVARSIGSREQKPPMQ